MNEFVADNLEHVLCGLILVARIGDIGSTYLVTPTLKLEGNPVARKLGWPFALATLLVCFVPYYDVALGVVVLVPSLLVSAANANKIWTAKALGEEGLHNSMLEAARKGSLRVALACLYGSCGFTLLTGIVLVVLCPDPARNWGYWFGLGIVVYGIARIVHGTAFYIRMFGKARSGAEQAEPCTD